jgi:hypothetical protein
MAGYSAKPLWAKLGFDPDGRVLLIGAPAGWRIAGAPGGLALEREQAPGSGSASADAVVAFFTERAALGEALALLAQRIFPAGALWIAWPRRAAGHESDIREQDIRELALPLGLVDVKVAALDEDWSGLRLVWRRERRRPPGARRR